ncbi:hypothetical protein HMPREF1550_02342 [Actinomyces sp. oral taxon 877 str. F0543]|nr:hypothetical protein HMPREF1550_02342 [Actinomyces sp. oral taxon 877 str. F0543]
MEFQAVPAGRAVEIVRAWAQHRWPMTVDEGVEVYTGLGFGCAGSDPEMFTSDLSPDEDVSYFNSEHGSECGCSCRTWSPRRDGRRRCRVPGRSSSLTPPRSPRRSAPRTPRRARSRLSRLSGSSTMGQESDSTETRL